MPAAKTAMKRELQAKCRAAQGIFKKRGVTSEEQDAIWEAVASVCIFQLEQGKGEIADYAKKFQGQPVSIQGVLSVRSPLNPRHNLHNHSPKGFEWGYLGKRFDLSGCY